MRRLIMILICVFLLIIDNTLLPFFAVKDYYPSSLFIFIIFFSINTDYWDAIEIGVISGILQDLYFCQVFGINSLTNMLLCLLAVLIGENIFKEKLVIPVFSLFGLSALKGVLVFGLLYIIGMKTDIYSVAFTSLYTMALGIFLYKSVYRLLQKPFMKKQWKF
ncbi:MAG: rod shape-determining protein MreD [Clostridia bacterium]|jgi:rod shape-determining protein MreD|nr:rod shape-determining protein MreD [Clostridia bacterium]